MNLPIAGHVAENTWDLYRRIAWKLLPVLFAVQVVGFLDRVNVGFAKLQMQSDLGLSNAAYGLGAGIFFIGYFLFEVPSNLLLNRVGAKVWFARILVTWGAATIAMAFVKDETWFLILRFIVGAAEAGFAPGTQLYFSQWFPAKYRGRINGLFLMSIPLSIVLGGPLAGLILQHLHRLGGIGGWQWLFIIEGLLSIGLTPWLLLALPSRIADARWLTGAERLIVERDVTALAHGAGLSTIRALLTAPRTLQLSLIYFLMQCGNYGVAFWLPQIMKNTGIDSPVEIGLLSACPYLLALITILAVGYLSDRSERRVRWLAACALVAAAGLALCGMFIQDTLIALLGLSLAAAGILGTIPVFWAMTARFYSGVAAAVGFAIINAIGNLGGFASPYLIGLIADAYGSPLIGLYALSAVEVLAVLLLLVYVHDRPTPRLAVAAGTGAQVP